MVTGNSRELPVGHGRKKGTQMEPIYHVVYWSKGSQHTEDMRATDMAILAQRGEFEWPHTYIIRTELVRISRVVG